MDIEHYQSNSDFDLTPPTRDQRTSLEADLTPEETDVLVRHGTEATFCGGLLDEHSDGVLGGWERGNGTIVADDMRNQASIRGSQPRKCGRNDDEGHASLN